MNHPIHTLHRRVLWSRKDHAGAHRRHTHSKCRTLTNDFFSFFLQIVVLYIGLLIRLYYGCVMWSSVHFFLREYRIFCTPSSDGTWYSTILHYLSTDIRLRIAAIDSSRDLWFFLFVTWNRESVCKFATTSTRSTWEISMRYNANYTAQVVWFVARTRYLSIIVQPKWTSFW